MSCPRGSIPFPQSRRSAKSHSPHFDSCPRSLRCLDSCLPFRSGWDPIGRRNHVDQCCSSGRPQSLPCTPVSMWGYCPIKRPSSTFIPFQCWSISPTNFDFTHTSFEVVQASITLQHNTLHFFCLYHPPPNRRNNLTDYVY